jgi:hypothetical protein
MLQLGAPCAEADQGTPSPNCLTLYIPFYRNDPSVITTTNKGRSWMRRLDIFLVPLHAARGAFGGGDPGNWEGYALKLAIDEPNCSFLWSDVLLSVEHRAVCAVLCSPPSEYKTELQQVISAQRLFAQDESQPASQASFHPSSPNMPSGPLNDVIHIAQASRSSTGFSTGKTGKWKLDEYEERPVEFARRSVDPMIYSGLYALGRLCHHPWITHAINLVVVSKCLDLS